MSVAHPSLLGKDIDLTPEGDGAWWWRAYDQDPETGNATKVHGTGYVHSDGKVEGMY